MIVPSLQLAIRKISTFLYEAIHRPIISHMMDQVANAHRNRPLTETDRLGLSFKLNCVSVDKYKICM